MSESQSKLWDWEVWSPTPMRRIEIIVWCKRIPPIRTETLWHTLKKPFPNHVVQISCELHAMEARTVSIPRPTNRCSKICQFGSLDLSLAEISCQTKAHGCCVFRCGLVVKLRCRMYNFLRLESSWWHILRANGKAPKWGLRCDLSFTCWGSPVVSSKLLLCWVVSWWRLGIIVLRYHQALQLCSDHDGKQPIGWLLSTEKEDFSKGRLPVSCIKLRKICGYWVFHIVRAPSRRTRARDVWEENLTVVAKGRLLIHDVDTTGRSWIEHLRVWSRYQCQDAFSRV